MMLLRTNQPSLGPIKAVLFDMDGTLLDTESLSDQAMIQAFGDAIRPDLRQELLQQGLPWILKGAIVGTRGDEWVPQVIDYACQHWGVTESPSVEDYWRRQEEILSSFSDRIQECKGATALVQSIAETGTPMAIATSSRRSSVEKKRQRHEAIFQHMEYIVTGEDVQNGKPAPDIYLKAADRLQVDPTECLVFEDAVAGCQSGQAAGCRVVAVPDPRMDKSLFAGIADEVLDDLTCFAMARWGLAGVKLN